MFYNKAGVVFISTNNKKVRKYNKQNSTCIFDIKSTLNTFVQNLIKMIISGYQKKKSNKV